MMCVRVQMQVFALVPVVKQQNSSVQCFQMQRVPDTFTEICFYVFVLFKCIPKIGQEGRVKICFFSKTSIMKQERS